MDMTHRPPLAPYASHAAHSRGRLHAKADALGDSLPMHATSDIRSPFQRDRDRIIHSAAFRKL